jgi:hypothetical protein
MALSTEAPPPIRPRCSARSKRSPAPAFTSVNGAQQAQSFKITYTDGTSTTLTQSLSDWFTPSNFPGETKALTMPHRVNAAGQIDNRTFTLYEYSLPLNSAKTVATVTFPPNRNVVILAATVATSTASVH